MPFKLGDNFRNEGIVGQFPFGLPLNFTYKSAPPILFNVKCFGHVIHFGGYPFHTIVMDPNYQRTFHIGTIQEHPGVTLDGSVDPGIFHDQVERVTFHPDLSNRLVFTSDTSVDIYKLSFSRQHSEISKLYSMGSSVQISNTPTMSSFGRQIKPKYPALVTTSCYVLATDFTQEFNIFSILGKHINDDSGFIKMYDSETGIQIRTIELTARGNVRDECFYRLFVEMDYVVITVRINPHKYIVHIYTM